MANTLEIQFKNSRANPICLELCVHIMHEHYASISVVKFCTCPIITNIYQCYNIKYKNMSQSTECIFLVEKCQHFCCNFSNRVLYPWPSLQRITPFLAGGIKKKAGNDPRHFSAALLLV